MISLALAVEHTTSIELEEIAYGKLFKIYYLSGNIHREKFGTLIGIYAKDVHEQDYLHDELHHPAGSYTHTRRE